MALQEKYASVVAAAQAAGVSNLSVTEQNGVLYVSGGASSSAIKDQVWDALGKLDPSFTASDINIDVQVVGLIAGASLVVVTESGNLNIRAQANTEADVVGKAAKGETVTLLEQTSTDWWKIKTISGEEGYAYARYLQA